jgi:hypothetical protein
MALLYGWKKEYLLNYMTLGQIVMYHKYGPKEDNEAVKNKIYKQYGIKDGDKAKLQKALSKQYGNIEKPKKLRGA